MTTAITTLEAAIHTWWADATLPKAVALNSLLGVASLVTGDMQNDDGTFADVPYCTLNRESNSQAWQTNCGRFDSGLLRFQVWHSDHAAGMAIRQAIVNCFDNQEYEIDDVTIESMQFQNDLAIQEEDGVWQFLIDFSVIHKVRVA